VSSAASVFPYPGGKTYHAKHIIPLLPKHHRYVEPFAGSASVLVQKPESYIEVVNDLDRDIVQFFRTLREQPDELAEFLQHVPFARDVHERWTGEFFDGCRPDGPIKRAGRWFFLRYSSYGAKANRPSGFKPSGKRSEPRSFRGAVDRLSQLADRFAEVTIECQDYQQVVERYDGSETVFYCDPPYLGNEHYYNAEGFDHGRLAEVLADTDSRWIVSYGETVPDAFDRDRWPVETFGAYYSLEGGKAGGRKPTTERLISNFEVDASTKFAPAGQTTLGEVAGGDSA